MRYIYQSVYNHAGRWLQSGRSERKTKRYAEFQNMEIVNEYSDEGKSGKSVEGRPEFQRMLDNIESGKLEHQYKLYLICSILNIIQHSLKFRSALYAFSRLTFIGILIYDFHVLKFFAEDAGFWSESDLC